MQDIIYTNIGPIVLALNPYNYKLPLYTDGKALLCRVMVGLHYTCLPTVPPLNSRSSAKQGPRLQNHGYHNICRFDVRRGNLFCYPCSVATCKQYLISFFLSYELEQGVKVVGRVPMVFPDHLFHLRTCDHNHKWPEKRVGVSIFRWTLPGQLVTAGGMGCCMKAFSGQHASVHRGESSGPSWGQPGWNGPSSSLPTSTTPINMPHAPSPPQMSLS